MDCADTPLARLTTILYLPVPITVRTNMLAYSAPPGAYPRNPLNPLNLRCCERLNPMI
jgi:hypothetical protein